MSVWPYMWGAAGLAFGLALLSRRPDYITPALSICAALVTVRLVRMGLDEETAKLAFASAWVSAGAFSARRLYATDANRRQSDTTCGLMICSGLCYFWGRVSGAPIVFGSAPYVAADLFAFAAIGLIGWGAGNVVVSRERGLGGSSRRRRLGFSRAFDKVSQEEKAGQ